MLDKNIILCYTLYRSLERFSKQKLERENRMIRLLFICVFLASFNASAKSAENAGTNIQRTNTVKICWADQPDDCEETVLRSNHLLSESLYYIIGDQFSISGKYERMRKYEEDLSRERFWKYLISEGFEVTNASNTSNVWYVTKN